MRVYAGPGEATVFSGTSCGRRVPKGRPAGGQPQRDKTGDPRRPNMRVYAGPGEATVFSGTQLWAACSERAARGRVATTG